MLSIHLFLIIYNLKIQYNGLYLYAKKLRLRSKYDVFHQGVKLQGHKTELSPSTCSEIKNCGVIPPLPHLYSWYSDSALLIEHRKKMASFVACLSAVKSVCHDFMNLNAFLNNTKD
jgi:hypothetical protein